MRPKARKLNLGLKLREGAEYEEFVSIYSYKIQRLPVSFAW